MSIASPLPQDLHPELNLSRIECSSKGAKRRIADIEVGCRIRAALEREVRTIEHVERLDSNLHPCCPEFELLRSRHIELCEPWTSNGVSWRVTERTAWIRWNHKRILVQPTVDGLAAVGIADEVWAIVVRSAEVVRDAR